MITIGFIVLAVMSWLSGIAASFTLFLIIRALAGVGQASYYGPQYALSSEAIPQDKLTLGTAIINSGMAFGTSGGYLLSSYLVLQNHQSWKVPFFVVAIPTFILAIVFFTCLKEKVYRPKENEKQEKQPEEKVSLKKIFTDKNLVAAFILCFCSIYANFVIITWLPSFLISNRGFQGGSVGFISSLVPWASIPGALIFAKLADKTGSTKKWIYILVPLSIISVFAIAFVSNKTLLIAVLILYGLTGKLAIDPIIVAYVTKKAPYGSLSTTLSAYNFIGMSGSILAPYITGWLADVTGQMEIGFYLGCGLLIIGLIVFAVMATDSEKGETAV